MSRTLLLLRKRPLFCPAVRGWTARIPMLTLLVLSCWPAAVSAYWLHVNESHAELRLTGEATTPVYTVYFHVPVETRVQAPLYIEVESDQLVDYRFLPTTGSNIIGVARMRSAPSSVLHWRAWTLVADRDYEDMPQLVPMTMLADLPDSVLPFLQPTATAQVDSEPVRAWADQNAGMLYLDLVAETICNYCYRNIPYYTSHSPASYDAFAALNWGGSCTGHAHAATALLRAMGIPARTKLCLLDVFSSSYDHHWTTEYFVPGYGWVGMDSTVGYNPLAAPEETVTYNCEPADEFPLFYTNGIDGFWHTSDPALGGRNPGWSGAHYSDGGDSRDIPVAEYVPLFESARLAFRRFVELRGARLPIEELPVLAGAISAHEEALARWEAGDPTGMFERLGAAIEQYDRVERGPQIVRWEYDAESGPLGWVHGGNVSLWEWGAPSAPGPAAARSGQNCWATDLDGNYGHGDLAWLETPPIDLAGLADARLEFWIWSLIAGTVYDANPDRLWLDITCDGVEYDPLCSWIVGGNDDPLIPVVTGWSRLDLDLTPYVGQTVQIRFHFLSNGQDTEAGAYLDDLRITGLGAGPSAVPDGSVPSAAGVLSGLRCSPNPFNPQTRIEYELGRPVRVRAAVYDLTGRRIRTLDDSVRGAGMQHVQWDGRDAAGRDAASGSYLLRVEADGEILTAKLMLVR